MPVDAALVGRTFPATEPLLVSADRVRTFADALGHPGDDVPPTFPIVVAFDAMTAFLHSEDLDLSRIIHGEQRFSYERPIQVGDVLSAVLEVVAVRQIGGADIIHTASRVHDQAGDLVCTGRATIVHGGGQ